MNPAPPRSGVGPRHLTNTKADAVRRALKAGPLSVKDIVEQTDLSSYEASGACHSLLRQKHVERLPVTGRSALYRLVVRPQRATLRGQDFAEAEETYVTARRAGRRPNDVALEMAITATAAESFEKSYRFQSTAGHSTDNSCPKFANHDLHLQALSQVGRFPGWPSKIEVRRAR